MVRKTIACLFVLVLAIGSGVAFGQTLTSMQSLGKFIFFDENLSVNGNQSCASCHAPAAGWVGPTAAINAHGAVYEGSVSGRFGDRKPPSAAYATQSPVLHMTKKGDFVGGNFWDGRATGEKLGNPAADQAQGPFLNPVEQALSAAGDVIDRICVSSYAALFRELFGDKMCDDSAFTNMAYDSVGLAVAAYEASPEVNAFSSRHDYQARGRAQLTSSERKGFALFQGKGKCSKCHISSGRNALFTDYTYDNLGIPKNPENPVYSYNTGFVDKGLGAFLASRPEYAMHAEANMGKHKVPTLRNVDLGSSSAMKAYGHNGYFKSLKGIVNFYNTRDVKPACPGAYTEAQALAAGCWPQPEVQQNINTAELGNLGLSSEEEDDIVNFLKTLSD